MPNWCTNWVRITPETNDDLQGLIDIFESPNPFSSLIPEPDWANTPNEKGIYPGPRYRDRWGVDCPRFPDGTQDDRWYGWRLNHWGVKWDIDPDDIHWRARNPKRVLSFRFDTAWDAPAGICEELRDRGFEVEWRYDEPDNDLSGHL